MGENDSATNLYNYLYGRGVGNLGTEEEFRGKLMTKSGRENFHKSISKDYNIGDYEEFDAKMTSALGKPVEVGESRSRQNVDAADASEKASATQTSAPAWQSNSQQSAASSPISHDWSAEAEAQKKADAEKQRQPMPNYASMADGMARSARTESKEEEIARRSAELEDENVYNYFARHKDNKSIPENLRRDPQSAQDVMDRYAWYYDQTHKDNTTAMQKDALTKSIKSGIGVYKRDFERFIFPDVAKRYQDEFANSNEAKALAEELQGKVSSGEMTSEDADNAFSELFSDTYGKQIQEEYDRLFKEHYSGKVDALIEKLSKEWEKSYYDDEARQYIAQEVTALSRQQNRVDISDMYDNIAKEYRALDADYKEVIRGYAPDRAQRSGEIASEQNLLKSASHIVEKAKEIADAASQGKGFFAGMGESLTDPNNYLFGLLELVDSKRVYDIATKINEDKEITPAEGALLDAIIMLKNTTEMWSEDIDPWYQSGKGVGDTIPFVASFIATGGLSGAASGASKATAKMVAKAMKKRVVASATKKLGKDAGKAAVMRMAGSMANGTIRNIYHTSAKLAGIAADAVVRQAVIAPIQTAIQPGTYAELYKHATGEIEKTEDGGYAASNYSEDIWHTDTALAQWIENSSENLGVTTAEFISLLNGLLKATTKSAWGKALLNFVDKVNIGASKVGKMTGFSGIFGEEFEELEGAIERYALGLSKDQFGNPDASEIYDFFEPENIARMTAQFAPQMILGGAANAVRAGVAHRKLSEAEDTFRGILSEYGVPTELMDEFTTAVKDGGDLDAIFSRMRMGQMKANDQMQLVRSVYEARSLSATISAIYSEDAEEAHTTMDEYAEEYRKSKEMIDQQTNVTDGNIINVSVSGIDGVCYVKSGKINFVQAGESTAVDKDNSDETIVVVDEKGKPHMIGIQDVTGFVGMESATDADGNAKSALAMAMENQQRTPVGSFVYNDAMPGNVGVVTSATSEGFTMNTRNEQTGEVQEVLVSNDEARNYKVADIHVGQQIKTESGEVTIDSISGDEVTYSTDEWSDPKTVSKDEFSELISSPSFAPTEKVDIDTPSTSQRQKFEGYSASQFGGDNGRATRKVMTTKARIDADVEKAQAEVDRINDEIDSMPDPYNEQTQSDYDAKKAELQSAQGTLNSLLEAKGKYDTLYNGAKEYATEAERERRAKLSRKKRAYLEAKDKDNKNELVTFVQSALESIGTEKPVVYTADTMIETMRLAGMSEADIEKAQVNLDNGNVVGGFEHNGVVYVNAERNSLENVVEAYVHERQHKLNRSNGAISRFDAVGISDERIKKALEYLSGTPAYENYERRTLIDELIAFSAQVDNGKNESDWQILDNIIGSQAVSTLKDIYDGQRKESSGLSNSRRGERNSYADRGISGEGTTSNADNSRYAVAEERSGRTDSDGRTDQGGERTEAGREGTPEGVSGESELHQIVSVEQPNPEYHNVEMDGDDVTSVTNNYGQAMFSISTWEDTGRSELDAFLASQVSRGKLTKIEADSIRKGMDDAYVMAKTFADSGEFDDFAQWSYAPILKTQGGDVVYSVVKPNAEYDMNLDFSLVCKKRRTLDKVLNRMIDRGDIEIWESSTNDDTIAIINDVIRKYGLETACKLCFVDAKRFRQAKVADDFVQLYNGLVNSLIKKGSNVAAEKFDFSGEGHSKPEHPLSEATDEDIDTSRLRKKIDAEDRSKGATPGRSVTYKIAKHLLEHPEDRRLLQRSDFMSTRGFDAVARENSDIIGLYNSKKGSGGPKAAQSDVQYLGDVANAYWDADKAYSVAGVRIQSFSDFMPHMVYDYMQMIADLSASKLPAHSYSKEETYVRLFGLTGIKINMSLVPHYDKDGIAPGLDKDGNYVWEDGETFPFDIAMEIQDTPGYRDNCGTIAVGISDEHIRKMLADPRIRMVIPYHKSGINKKVAVHNGIDRFTDYTSSQNTRYSSGKKISKEDSKKIPNFNDLLKEMDAIDASKEYIRACNENGFIPKFAQFLDGGIGNYSYTDGYYKLLEDYTTMVPNQETGALEYKPLGEVRFNMPTAESGLGSAEEIVRQALSEEGDIVKRQDKHIEDIVDDIENEIGANRTKDTAFQITEADEKAYSDAVESGDMEKVSDILSETALKMGYIDDEEYRTAHRAPSNDGFCRPLYDVVGMYPEDVYSDSGLRHYGFEGHANEESWNVMRKVRGVPDAMVTIYRTVPAGVKETEIRNGDWVTTSREYAEQHRDNIDGETRIIKQEVPAKYVWTNGDSLSEYGYDDGKKYVYKNTENGRKLLEPTFDDNGNLIPLSERFNSESDDVRFQIFNRGYQGENERGTRISTRGGLAQSAGKYTKADFIKNYGLKKATFEFLVKVRVITDTEWHHTGKNFARSTFYNWADNKNEGTDDALEFGMADSEYYESYKRNKNEVDRLVSEFNDKEYEFEDFNKSEENLMSFDEWVERNYEHDEYLTDDESSDMYKEHDRISGLVGTMSSYDRMLLHKDVDARYNKILKKRYIDSVKRRNENVDKDYEEYVLGVKRRNDDVRRERDAVIKKNEDSNGAEVVGMKILEILGDDHRRAYDSMATTSYFSREKEKRERDEAIRGRILSVIEDAKKEEREKFDKYVKGLIKSGKAEYFERLLTIPENSEATKEEMNGRYGWFKASSTYKLPIYYSGITFKSKSIRKNYVEKKQDLTRIDMFGIGYAFDKLGLSDKLSKEDVDWINNEYPNRTSFQLSNDNQRIFVSNAESAVKAIKQEKATPSQWLAMLEKSGGLKAGEDKWMGLSDWLKESKEKTITKDDLLTFIGENAIQIDEVKYAYDANISDYSYKEDFVFSNYLDSPSIQDAILDNTKRENGKYVWTNGYNASESEKRALDELNRGVPSDKPVNRIRAEYYTTHGLNNLREIALTVPTIEPYNKSDEIHFGDAGEGRAVAWIRFGDTTDSEGNKVLVIDEVQSKRHQDGREEGYKSNKSDGALNKYYDALSEYVENIAEKYGLSGDAVSNWTAYATDDEYKEYSRLRYEYESELARQDEDVNKVPDAPFDKNWMELCMKRMLRYAAENGYGKVAWTSGEQQADRYNLSKQIDKIKSHKKGDGNYLVELHKDGNVIKSLDVEEDKLSGVVGKNIAEKIIANPRGFEESEDLSIGGEGMKSFYDKMIPSFMGKYCKKWGSSVGEVVLPKVEASGRTMWSVDVTDSMKESVMQGQPMFQITQEMEDEYRNAVEDGDMDKASEMVREVAKRNGYTKKATHNTNDKFTVFGRDALGENTGSEDAKAGFHFLGDEFSGSGENRTQFGENEMGVYLKLGKTLDATHFTPEVKELLEEALKDNGEELAELGITAADELYDYLMTDDSAVDDGGLKAFLANQCGAFSKYDSMVTNFGAGEKEYIVANPNQIKSADAVVYDDNGNVIPLGERFSEGSDDIRYQITSEKPEREEGESAEEYMKLEDVKKDNSRQLKHLLAEGVSLRKEIGGRRKTATKDIELLKKYIESGKESLYSEDKAKLDRILYVLENVSGITDVSFMAGKAERIITEAYSKADAKLISDYIQKALRVVDMDELSRGNINRLLSSVKNAVASSNNKFDDIVDNVNKIISKAYLKSSEEKFKDSLRKPKMTEADRKKPSTAKQDIKGFLDYAKDYIENDTTILNEIIDECNVVLSGEYGPSKKESARQKLLAIGIAMRYKEAMSELAQIEKLEDDISGLEDDNSILRKEAEDDSISDDKKRKIRRKIKMNNDTISSIVDDINGKRIDVAKVLENLATRVNLSKNDIRDRFKDFEDERYKRYGEIYHAINSDLRRVRESNWHDVEKEDTKIVRAAKSFTSHLHTLEYELRKLGLRGRQLEGEGRLFKFFNPRLNQASSTEFTRMREIRKRMDEKAKELFGTDYSSAMKRRSNRYLDATFSWWNDGPVVNRLTEGQAAYIYAVNKMSDGKMKLRAMGISEEDVEQLVDMMSPAMVKMTDWIQHELLPSLRETYADTHMRVFGTQMGEIDNYIPLKIDQRYTEKKEDIANNQVGVLPSTIVGSIINRTSNLKPVNIAGTDILDMTLSHIQEMEHWNAYAEVIDSLNKVLSNNKFRNKMATISPDAFKWFKDAAQISTGNFRTDKADGEAVVDMLKRVGGAKVAFRLSPAFKQLLSSMSCSATIDPRYHITWVKGMTNPFYSVNWAMDNLPLLQKRWESKLMGNEKLDYIGKSNNAVLDFIDTMTSKYGLAANSAIDLYVCSAIARATYESKFNEYKSRGMNEDEANVRAINDAENAYNTTQQSAEGQFMSRIQSESSFISSSVSLFNNSSFAYGRKFILATKETVSIMKNWSEYRERRRKTLAETYPDMSEEDLDKYSRRDTNKAMIEGLMRMGMYGYVVNLVWNIGSGWYTLVFDPDPDKKRQVIEEAASLSFDAPLRNSTWGKSIESAYAAAKAGMEMRDGFGDQLHPALAGFTNVINAGIDLYSIFKEDGAFGEEAIIALNTIIQYGVEASLGFTPQTAQGVAEGIADLIELGGDATYLDIAQDFGMIASAPPSQVRNMVLKPRKGETMEQFVDRYVWYKKVTKFGPLRFFAEGIELKTSDMKRIYPEVYGLGTLSKQIKAHNKGQKTSSSAMIDAKVKEAKSKIKRGKYKMKDKQKLTKMLEKETQKYNKKYIK